MARQTKGQKETVERVMHEFKHGELKTAGGRKVTNPKQAIATGLSEAGASDQQSPEENRKRLRQTKAKERQGQTGRTAAQSGKTRAALYEEAKKRNLPGRSRLSKAELEQALRS